VGRPGRGLLRWRERAAVQRRLHSSHDRSRTVDRAVPREEVQQAAQGKWTWTSCSSLSVCSGRASPSSGSSRP
jgi:hypothetical protein